VQKTVLSQVIMTSEIPPVLNGFNQKQPLVFFVNGKKVISQKISYHADKRYTQFDQLEKISSQNIDKSLVPLENLLWKILKLEINSLITRLKLCTENKKCDRNAVPRQLTASKQMEIKLF
jgi:hypothetical protein